MSNNNNTSAAQYIIALTAEPKDLSAFNRDVLERFPTIKRGDMIAVWISVPKKNPDLVCWLTQGTSAKDEEWYIWTGEAAHHLRRFINFGEMPEMFSVPDEFPIDHWSGNRNSFGPLLMLPFNHLKYRQQIEKNLTYEITEKRSVVRAYFKCDGKGYSFIIPCIEFDADEWIKWQPRVMKAIFGLEDMGPVFQHSVDDEYKDLRQFADDRTFYATFCYTFGGRGEDLQWFDEWQTEDMIAE